MIRTKLANQQHRKILQYLQTVFVGFIAYIDIKFVTILLLHADHEFFHVTKVNLKSMLVNHTCRLPWIRCFSMLRFSTFLISSTRQKRGKIIVRK